MYCKKCGGKIESYSSHCPFCGEAIANNSVEATYTSSNGNMVKSNKSIGGWILTHILTAIPLVGLIMLFVWAFGEETKADPTFRNWARTQLIVGLIAGIFIIVMVIVVIALGLALSVPEGSY